MGLSIGIVGRVDGRLDNYPWIRGKTLLELSERDERKLC
jgi:hypothetical protein